MNLLLADFFKDCKQDKIKAPVFSISPVALIIGFLPVRQQRLVEAWAELHQEELLADWQLLEAGRKPAPITPLQ